MSVISQNLKLIENSIPREDDITLVAVSKYFPVASIMEAYKAGQRIFGESRVNELVAKCAELPSDIKWHFIGHLQTNKVARLLRVPGLTLIQSVDSLRLLAEIDKEAAKGGITVKVLMEVHVAQEETKFGFSAAELEAWFESRGDEAFPNVMIMGVMGMASNTDDEIRVRDDFRNIAACFKSIKEKRSDLADFNTLSMGMSGDYLIAIEEGSNMIRVGSAIFEEG